MRERRKGWMAIDASKGRAYRNTSPEVIQKHKGGVATPNPPPFYGSSLLRVRSFPLVGWKGIWPDSVGET